MAVRNRKKGAEKAAPAETKAYVTEIESESEKLLSTVDATEAGLQDYYLKLLNKSAPDEETRGRVESLRRAAANLLKAWNRVYAAGDELNARWNDAKRVERDEGRKLNLAPPSNAEVDLSESRSKHFFAKGLNPYKLLLIFYIGSFAGVVVEMLWCLVRNGYIESRAGVVYGPFNPLYGAGAVILTVCLYRFRNRGSWLSFIGGMLVGSALEYVCSWGQEFLFGTRSWDYSNVPFNLNGRICLLYSIFWGVLSVLWIKNLYPRMAELILKIPNRVGKAVTWLLTIFFIFDIFMSGAALYRWSAREAGEAPASAFGEFVDEHFPDERMEKIYANMEFVPD